MLMRVVYMVTYPEVFIQTSNGDWNILPSGLQGGPGQYNNSVCSNDRREPTTLSGISGYPIRVKSKSRLSTVPPPSRVSEPIPIASALPDYIYTVIINRPEENIHTQHN